MVERDYPNTYYRYTAVAPLLETLGNGGKGTSWNTAAKVRELGELNHVVTEEAATKGRPSIATDIDAAEVVPSLAPETNGHVATKAWEALSRITGREHRHLASRREDEKIRFRDIVAQPRKIITSPTWSRIENESVSYNARYINVNELIPWRTLTGRQHFYQDHRRMRDFGEGFALYRPPVDTRSVSHLRRWRDHRPRAMLIQVVA